MFWSGYFPPLQFLWWQTAPESCQHHRSGTRPRHRGSRIRWLHPLLKEWQRRALAQCRASWLSEARGTAGVQPPSGVCHWIRLTPWWETWRIYNVCLHLCHSLCINGLDKDWQPPPPPSLACLQIPLPSCSCSSSPSTYLSLVWR